MRKKVDHRIRTLVENGVKLRQRSLFVIVGDRGRDQARHRLVPRGCWHRLMIARRGSGLNRSPCGTALVSFLAGCQPALYAVEGERQSAAERALVLQKGPVPQQPPQETHEAGA